MTVLLYDSGFGFERIDSGALRCLKDGKHPDIRADVKDGPTALRDKIDVPVVLEGVVYFVKDEDFGGFLLRRHTSHRGR